MKSSASPIIACEMVDIACRFPECMNGKDGKDFIAACLYHAER